MLPRLRFRVVLAGWAAALAWASATHAQPAPEGASGWIDKRAVVAQRFLAATANPHATDAAYAMLARGGSAVDAAIAAQLVLGLVEPQSSGLGGGAFLLVHDARKRKLSAYDGRETAPAGARPERFLRADGTPLPFREAVASGLAVGVPGTMRVLELAHGRHGRLAWADLFAPAIALADAGFTVSPRLATLVAADTSLAASPSARAYFHDADGRPLACGHDAAQSRLRGHAAHARARGRRRVLPRTDRAGHRRHGARPRGATGRPRARRPRRLPRDRARARVRNLSKPSRVRDARAVVGRHDGAGDPRHSSSASTSASMGAASFWSVHVMSEAGRLAYADRDAYVGDPAFVDVPAGFVDPAYLRERSSLIALNASLGKAAPGAPPSVAARAAATADEFPSTSHLSIVDAEGNAVSMTTTIEDAFGSRLMTRGGFLLNNQLTDFASRPVVDGRPVANRLEPGKRPRSSMAPTIVYDARGRVAIVAGSPGGSSIINYVAKTLVAMIDWSLDPQAAVALPNFGSRNGPTELERDTPVAALADRLRAIGHDVAVIPMTSGTQALARTATGWAGGADPRREGTVRGR